MTDFESRPHYVYRHFDADDRLLYVGITVNPKRRPFVRRDRPWMDHSARVVVDGPMSRAAATAEERRAIREDIPAWNVYENNGNVTGWHRVARAEEATLPAEGTPEYRAILQAAARATSPFAEDVAS